MAMNKETVICYGEGGRITYSLLPSGSVKVERIDGRAHEVMLGLDTSDTVRAIRQAVLRLRIEGYPIDE